jgi:hypothetical protein
MDAEFLFRISATDLILATISSMAEEDSTTAALWFSMESLWFYVWVFISPTVAWV